ncbi:MAG TPA: PmoA family protein [Cellulomonas sp.]|nr:PmoA family protein [Cellulomonas sp.]
MSGAAPFRRTGTRPSIGAMHDVGRSIDVTWRGETLVRYVYVPDDVQLESPRPYLHPLRTRAGDVVTEYRPHDHVWHKGIAWSLPCVGPHNFWGGPTYVQGEGYVQLDNDGSMDHEELTRLDVVGDTVTLEHTLAWHSQAGAHVVSEKREIAVTVPADRDDAWVLTFDTTMTNVSDEDLPIGSPTTRGRENAGYGGLFWRGPRSFTGGTLLAPDFAGGEEIRGERAEWMGFTGAHDGSGSRSSIVIVDGSDNPSHPPQWFARNEWFAGLNPAPFFSTEVAFDAGATLRFRYAVVVADGGVDAAGAAELAALGCGRLVRAPTAE